MGPGAPGSAPGALLKPAHLPGPAPCSKVDQLAAKVGADPHLVSRAAMAMQQALGAAAAEEGHTYLPWHRLEKDCARLLRDVGVQHATPWQHQAALHLVAQHMHSCGAIVAEPPPAAGGAAAAATAEGQAPVAAAAGGEAAAAAAAPEAAARAAPARTHPTFGSMDDLRQYLNARLKGGLGGQPCVFAGAQWLAELHTPWGKDAHGQHMLECRAAANSSSGLPPYAMPRPSSRRPDAVHGGCTGAHPRRAGAGGAGLGAASGAGGAVVRPAVLLNCGCSCAWEGGRAGRAWRGHRQVGDAAPHMQRTPRPMLPALPASHLPLTCLPWVPSLRHVQ